MTPPVITAPTFPSTAPARTDPAHDEPTCSDRTPASGLPAARTADPAECGALLEIDVDDRGGVVVVRARGEVDMLTVTDLRAALAAQLAAGTATVVLDLRGVSFVDCTGIGMLAEARRRAGRRGIRLRIVPGRAVTRVAALLDLSVVLGLHDRV
jgi:anti-sigma B factor antagonist